MENTNGGDDLTRGDIADICRAAQEFECDWVGMPDDLRTPIYFNDDLPNLQPLETPAE